MKRSSRRSTRCAAPRTLYASWPIVFVIALVAGAALVGIGGVLVRSGERSVAWCEEIVGEGCAAVASERLEVLTRLAIVRDAWATELLRRAASDDPDAAVRLQARKLAREI